MAEELQHLIERIRKEGVESGEKAAESLVAEAKKKAAAIVADAQKQAKDLVAKITAMIGSIPLAQLPASFEIPGDPPATLALRPRPVTIAADGVRLEFDL